MRILGMTLGILAVVAGCSPASERSGEQDAELAAVPPAYLPDTESRVLTSTITGRTYQVSVAVPRGYSSSAQSYPVLYALDANGEFGTVVETARHMRLEELVPALIIVGIGYPVGHFYDASEFRATDLTPTFDPDYEEISVRESPDWPVPDGNGGAPQFLRFLTAELVPLIEEEYRTDPDDRALYGHSYGGLFALHALLQGERAFQRFIIGSPTLWWDDRVSFEQESAYAAANASLPARVFLSMGSLEDDAVRDDVPWGRMVSNFKDFVAVLEGREYAGLELMPRLFEDEYHTSVVPATISRGIRYIYTGQ